MPIPIARFFTYLFQPLLMPFYGTIIFLWYDDLLSLQLPLVTRLYILGFIFLLTFLLPALAALLMKNMGVIKSLEMETREERKIPLLFTAFIYTAVFFIIGQVPILARMRVFVLATTITVIVSGFITNYYKISIHMTGCGGVVGLIALMASYSYHNLTWLLAAAIIVSGFVGVSRIVLKAHTHGQVYLGFTLGFLMVFLMGLFL
ncbi:MAG TPA: hypothetical protein VEC12_10785 [Bacteroidia bacterium]|nr:hypothetical protein [Bacteroidia bacterium]